MAPLASFQSSATNRIHLRLGLDALPMACKNMLDVEVAFSGNQDLSDGCAGGPRHLSEYRVLPEGRLNPSRGLTGNADAFTRLGFGRCHVDSPFVS